MPEPQTNLGERPRDKSGYLTAPIKTTGMPPGVPYIVGNEAAERFSYYGMNSILVVFMTHYMVTAAGAPDRMTPEKAQEWYHNFVSCAYILPVFGAILADGVLGKYRTVFLLSIVYCFGHLALALDQTRVGLLIGMGLIALGAGGIKPCVSANVGDQFGANNQHLLPRVFSWFYFSINFGAMFSTMLVPWLLDPGGFCKKFSVDVKFAPHIAFGTPGIFMVIATVVFWMGRKKYVHIPPGGARFWRELTSREGLTAIGNLAMLVPFVAMFWAVWQQNFSSWVVQAEKMDRHVFGQEWLPAQIQTVNPIFILAFLPLFSYWIYPAVSKVFPLTALRRISIGLFLAVVAFLIPAWVQTRIDAGQTPHIGWHILAFAFLSSAEIMVSVTHLEFSYTQAPRTLKSIVVSLYLAPISLGNLFTGQVNRLIQNEDGSSKLAGASYFWFFCGVMFVTAVLFIFVATKYKGKTYVQEETPTGH